MSLSTIVVQKRRCVVYANDLNCGVRDPTFEGKVLNKYSTYDWITKKLIDDPSYAYLYCEFFDAIGSTTITLRVKSPHIHVHEQLFQKGFYVRIENFGIKAKSQQRFKKGDMLILIMIKSKTIVSHSNISALINSSIFSYKFPTRI